MMAEPSDILSIDTTVADLKLVYRVLHRHLAENLELMDADVFERIQRVLQERAKRDGIDVGDHAAWDAWLGGDSTPCDVRLEGRKILA